MHYGNVDFVTDPKTTVDAFYNNRIDVREFGMSSQLARLFLPIFFQTLIEFHIPQTNEVVHVFIGETTFSASPTTYFDVPNYINTLIINEMV